MATGYDIQCMPGDLYTRQCFIGDPKDGKKIEAYTQSGDPIAVDMTTGKTYLQRLDMTGNPYEPYGSAGVPYTILDSGPLSSLLGAWMPSTGSSSQAFNRLMTLPGAQARVRAAKTTVPWYYNVFGLRFNQGVVGQPPIMRAEDGGSSHVDESTTGMRDELWSSKDRKMLLVVGVGTLALVGALFFGDSPLTR
jgi:hypothetical protein